MEKTRLNKYIAQTGFCSRRKADDYIQNGHVLVNGSLPQLGEKVSDDDVVKVNGKIIGDKPKTVYLALNKPIGVTSTTDLKDPDNMIDYLNYPERIFHIGRLDKPSEGLIFLTNDGDIVNKILRAENHHEKEYIVTVDHRITSDFIKKMSSGVPILDTVTKPCVVEQINKVMFRIILTQGLNRQIRRMCSYLGYEVTKLKRTRIMNITLDGIPYGEYRHFTNQEIETLNALLKDSIKSID